ncbi:hypothetical protein SMICM304S_05737 [Streptomyces microflavus]
MSAREESSRRFVADMSHELRTPLTAITAVAEVLEDEADSLEPDRARRADPGAEGGWLGPPTGWTGCRPGTNGGRCFLVAR